VFINMVVYIDPIRSDPIGDLIALRQVGSVHTAFCNLSIGSKFSHNRRQFCQLEVQTGEMSPTDCN